MGTRVQLQTILEDILGSRNVYFQPPENFNLLYPCIIYKRNNILTSFADDQPYNHKTQYSITVIDRDPDSEIPVKISKLPMCKFERHYSAENLNHDVYNIYY
jgi:hypothetical protein